MHVIKILIVLIFPFILIGFMVSRCDEMSSRSSARREPFCTDEQETELQDTGDSSQPDTETATDTAEVACVPKVFSFVNSLDGYWGCTDIELQQRFPDEPGFLSDTLTAVPVGDPQYPYSSKSQVLIRMNDIFGHAENQIPTNAKITNASLTVFTQDARDGEAALHRMLADWDQGTVWNDVGGITPNDVEAAAVPDDIWFVTDLDRYHTFDVTPSLTTWQSDPAKNRGWVVLSNSEDGFDMMSSEAASVEQRPRLDIEVCGTLPDRSSNLPPKVLTLLNPVNEIPVDAASSVLDVVAIDADSDLMDITFYGRERGEEFWTAIVLPDTQYYTLDREWPKGIFSNQTQWIVNYRETLNIQVVLSLGDLVETASVPEHWARADEALTTIIDADIPYMPTPGDHDHVGQDDDGDLTLFSDTFPETRFSDDDWWGDVFDDSNSSHYILLTIGSDDYLFIGLDFCPDEDELGWADDVLELYSDRKAILTTHAFLDDLGGYYATPDCGRHNSQVFYMWESLVSRHDNLTLVLSGHMHLSDGEYRRTDDNMHGVPVHQIISDYQMRSPDAGNGLLRIMNFFPSQDRIRVLTYSPYTDTLETDEDSRFDLPFEMSDDRPFEPIGAVTGVSSGAHATLYWNDLLPNTTYEWYAVASDGTLESKGPVWTFTTAAEQ